MLSWLLVALLGPAAIAGEPQVGPNRWTQTGLARNIGSLVVDVSQIRIYAIDSGLDVGFAALWTSDGAGQSWSKIVPSDQAGPVYVAAVAVDPSAPGTAYVGTGGCNPRPPLSCYGQVFKTMDDASHWQLLKTPVYAGVSAIAISPSRPEIVYVAAYTWGEYFGFRSSDGGESWTQLPSVFPYTTHAILIEAGDADTIYIGGDGGLEKSSDGGASWSAPALRALAVRALVEDTRTGSIYAATDSGLYSTRDGGATWSLLGFAGGVQALAMDSRSGRLYASSVKDGVEVTTDGGQTWSRVGSGLPQAGGLALSGSSLLYAASSGGVYKLQLHDVGLVPFR